MVRRPSLCAWGWSEAGGQRTRVGSVGSLVFGRDRSRVGRVEVWLRRPRAGRPGISAEQESALAAAGGGMWGWLQQQRRTHRRSSMPRAPSPSQRPNGPATAIRADRSCSSLRVLSGWALELLNRDLARLNNSEVALLYAAGRQGAATHVDLLVGRRGIPWAGRATARRRFRWPRAAFACAARGPRTARCSPGLEPDPRDHPAGDSRGRGARPSRHRTRRSPHRRVRDSPTGPRTDAVKRRVIRRRDSALLARRRHAGWADRGGAARRAHRLPATAEPEVQRGALRRTIECQ
jgi:hypothetical protein